MRLGKRRQLYIHPAGIAAALLALLFCPSHLVFAALIALVLHEAGHMAALLLLRVRSWRFELTPFGGMADVQDYDALRPYQQMICAAAGIGASATGAWICCSVLPNTAFTSALFRFQLSLAVVNCLPVWPLDGARIVTAAASWLGWENGVRILLCRAALVIGMALMALGLWGAWKGVYNPSLLIAGPYLCYAAAQGNVADRLRRLGKLQSEKRLGGRLVPIAACVCAKDELNTLIPRMLGRFSSGRYQLLISIDEEGSIAEVFTQDELIRQVFEDGKD